MISEQRRRSYGSTEEAAINYHADFNAESSQDLTCYDETDFVYEEYEPLNLPPFAEDKAENFQTWKSNRPSFFVSLCRCIWLTMQTTVLCGIVFGVVGALVWWLDLNLTIFCLKFAQNLQGMPIHLKRLRLTTIVLKSMIIQFWSFFTVVPVFDWTSLKQLNLPMLNLVTATTDAICRLLFGLYGIYDRKWIEYICNALFFFTVYLNYTRIARHKKKILCLSAKSFLLASKLATQFILGLFVSLISTEIIFPATRNMSQFESLITVSVLPLFVMIPKLVASLITGKLIGLFSPGRAVMFTIASQVGGALACRLAQAFQVAALDDDEFRKFVIISLAHAILKILDKILLPLKEKLPVLTSSKDNSQETTASLAAYRRSMLD